MDAYGAAHGCGRGTKRKPHREPAGQKGIATAMERVAGKILVVDCDGAVTRGRDGPASRVLAADPGVLLDAWRRP